MSETATASTTVDQVATFAGVLYDPSDIVEIRIISEIPDEDPVQTWHRADALINEIPRLEKLNGGRRNVFVSANPRKARYGSTDEDVALARSLFVDIDHMSVQDAMAKVEASKLPTPTIIVSSGHGSHFYWKLTEPITDLSVFRAYQKGLIKLLGGDPRVHDPARIMRLPGFVNQKREPVDCEIVECSSAEYEWSEILPLIEKIEEKKQENNDDANSTTSATDRQYRRCLGALVAIAHVDRNDGSFRLYTYACRCVEHGLNDADAIRCIRDAAKIQPFGKNFTDAEITKRLRDAEKRAVRGQEADTTATLTPISAGALCRDFPELKPVVIEGVARETESMNLIAPSKVGKTYLALNAAISVVAGRPWLNAKVNPGPVLYIDCELHKTTLARRVATVAKAMNVTMPQIENSLDLLSLRGQLRDLYALAPFFVSIPKGKYRMIVLDALYRLLPEGVDENSNADITALYNRIDQYGEQTGAAFLIVHHASKGNQSNKAVIDVGSGAGAQSRAADCHIALRPHREDNVVVMEAAVRSFAPFSPVCLRWDYPLWSVDSSLDPSDLRQQGKREDSEKPDMTPAEFVEAFVKDQWRPVVEITIDATMNGIRSERAALTMLNRAIAAGLVEAGGGVKGDPKRCRKVQKQ